MCFFCTHFYCTPKIFDFSFSILRKLRFVLYKIRNTVKWVRTILQFAFTVRDFPIQSIGEKIKSKKIRAFIGTKNNQRKYKRQQTNRENGNKLAPRMLSTDKNAFRPLGMEFIFIYFFFSCEICPKARIFFFCKLLLNSRTIESKAHFSNNCKNINYRNKNNQPSESKQRSILLLLLLSYDTAMGQCMILSA